MDNVEKIVESNLCISCEACIASCPMGAITRIYKDGQFLPKIDKNKCNNCGLCLKVCPSSNLKKEIIKNDQFFTKEVVGNVLNSYSVYTKDKEILKNSTSGGVISTLIINLLQKNKIKGAFVLPFDSFNNEPARLVFFQERDGVLKSSKSKYIPSSIFNIIKKLEKDSKPNFAIVGTPCQFLAIKKYIKFKKIDDSNLLFLGLVCDKTMNFNFLKYIEDKYKRKSEKMTKIFFRDKEKEGWPGDLKIFFDSGKKILIDRKERMRVKDYFQLERCVYCLDKFNKLADISFGDCYLKEKKDFKEGISSVLVRTEKGKEFFEEFSYLFNIEEANLDEILTSQKINEKKKNLNFLEYFIGEKNISSKKIEKELKKIRKKIYFGKNYEFKKFRKILIINLIKSKMFKIIKKIFYKKQKAENNQKNIILVGGNLSNKGAQAMVFTVVNNLKKNDPNINIFLCSEEDYKKDKKEKEKYNFYFIPALSNIFKNKKQRKEIKEIIKNTKCFIDISGYALSSSFFANPIKNFITSLRYIFPIFLAKRFHVSYYIFPQSIGPLNYPFFYKILLFPFLKIYLKYPEKIFIREKDGIKQIKKYTEKNIELKKDIVLTGGEYDLKNIFKKDFFLQENKILENSVAIIPNKRIFVRIGEDEFEKIYKNIINKLISLNKNVYILRHSSEDLFLCNKIKNIFLKEEKVKIISDDLTCIELEKIISQFDFVVASRYHSIVHAYKQNIPVICIGWAVKYFELLETFSQLDYFFDVNKKFNNNDLIDKIDKMSLNLFKNKDKIKFNKEKLSDKNLELYKNVLCQN